ncbi:MAG: protein kinase [Pirellulaceae bacterium]|nr:MAG: protein kinase [Pirellulaceae bacterium]
MPGPSSLCRIAVDATAKWNDTGTCRSACPLLLADQAAAPNRYRCQLVAAQVFEVSHLSGLSVAPTIHWVVGILRRVGLAVVELATMPTMTAERFAQRLFELGLADNRQINAIWADLGTRSVSVEEFIAAAVRKEVITNFQAERVLKGERSGFFYGKYKVLYLVGTGSFARVYRAVHTETGRIAAVKVLRKRYRDNPVELEQFLREGHVGEKLRHPNIVPVYEVNSDPREPYLVMEFVEGQTLKEMVRLRGKLEPPLALKIISDVLNALQYAIEQGVTHRDLKMSNVLVSSSGKSKLVDFGLAARHFDDKDLAECPNARAIDYAALERGTGVRKDDLRSDIYFAGCLLYHMLCGKAPLLEVKDRLYRLNITRFREITPLSQLEPGLPHYILAIVNKAMELDPQKRYQTPAEMLKDVQQALKRWEAGDRGGTSAASAAEPAAPEQLEVAETERQATSEDESQTAEGDSRRLMIIESHVGMQDLLRDRLKKRGYRVLIYSDPERALQRFADSVDGPPADCVLFFTTELKQQAVDAFNRFGEHEATRQIPAVLVLHQADPSWMSAARTSPDRVVLTTPKLGELRSTLLRLLKLPVPASSS